MQKQNTFLFTKNNYLLFACSIALITLGYVIMALNKNSETQSIASIIVLLSGYLLTGIAVMLKFKE